MNDMVEYLCTYKWKILRQYDTSCYYSYVRSFSNTNSSIFTIVLSVRNNTEGSYKVGSEKKSC